MNTSSISPKQPVSPPPCPVAQAPQPKPLGGQDLPALQLLLGQFIIQEYVCLPEVLAAPKERMLHWLAVQLQMPQAVRCAMCLHGAQR